MSITINILFILVQLFYIGYTIRYFKFSPVYIYIIFSLLSITLSTLYFYYYPNKFSLYNLDFISEKEFLYTLNYYLLSLNAFMFGVITFHDLSPKSIRSLFSHDIDTNFSISFNIKEKQKNSIIIYFVFLFFMFIIVYGKTLFIREQYASFDKLKGFVILLILLSFIGVILSAILYRKNKIISILLFSLLLILYIGTASRLCFIFLLLYIIITYFSSINRGFLKKIKFVLLVILSFFFLAYLMQLRSLPEHGLIPYLSYFFQMDFGVIEKFLFNIYYFSIFGFFVTVDTIKVATYDWTITLININPLPGSFVGWYDYADSRRLNIYCPYSTHGEAFRMGKVFTFFFFFFIGLFFSFFDRHARKMFKSGQYFMSLMLVILLSLHIFYAYEYNMRASVRNIYYALFYLFVLFLLKHLKKYLIIKRKDVQ